MPTIQFPNVPKVPGVPSIARSANFPPAARAVLGAAQGALFRALQVGTKWGIFDSKGKSLVDESDDLINSVGFGQTTSFSGLDVSGEAKISDFPVEQGKFASYNKAEMPTAVRVTLAMCGSESERAKFLLTLETAKQSTELYAVATPEYTFTQMALEAYRYSRTSANGATLLKVELSFRKVREVTAQFSTISRPKDAGAAPISDSGRVQPKAPQVSTLKSLANKLPSLAESINSTLRGLVQ